MIRCSIPSVASWLKQKLDFGRLVRPFTAGLLIVAVPCAASPVQNPATAPLSADTPLAQAAGSPAERLAGPAVLTKADLDTWLDGYMPYALESGDIAGAEVVVVKDGQILTQRGFGHADLKTGRPVDPAKTLFRLGSISKLFTWTAVMQLVQAGKLDLDRDVNAYLDFKIPPYEGKPVTLRNLMTHTAGFAETLKYILTYDPKTLAPLDKALKRFVPARLYAPGTMPAYSNYGASLAGYIVQRVSGEPFDTYIERHILAPLDIQHSTFRQPLPAKFQADMSQGYVRASDGAKPFELVALAPAGALSATGTDMARLMLAYLSGGGPLLAPDTTSQMLSVANRPIAGLPAMALGFYHEDRNGQRIAGHGGDTALFHSDLILYLDQGVGFYVAFNSSGKEGATHAVRERLFTFFTDRYFPAPIEKLPTLPTARAHGEALSGHYVSSRASGFTFGRLVALLGQTTVHVNEDGTLSVSGLTDASGALKRWREVGPWQWLEVGGRERLHAVVDQHGVKMFSIGAFAPIFEFLPAPVSLNAGWILPLLLIALIILLIAGVFWPVSALVRRHYGRTMDRSGTALLQYRAVGAAAICALLIALGWLMVMQAIGADLGVLDGRLDGWIRALQILSMVFIAGTVIAVWRSVSLLRTFRRNRWTAVWSALCALAMVFLCWLIVDAGLLTTSLSY